MAILLLAEHDNASLKAATLNVVTAAAIALGEALRQTNGFPTPAGTG